VAVLLLGRPSISRRCSDRRWRQLLLALLLLLPQLLGGSLSTTLLPQARQQQHKQQQQQVHQRLHPQLVLGHMWAMRHPIWELQKGVLQRVAVAVVVVLVLLVGLVGLVLWGTGQQAEQLHKCRRMPSQQL